MAGLTVKQQKFIDYYIATGNATESAIKAGYSKKTAFQTGAENLRKPYIQGAIKEKLSELASERVATAQEVLEGLTAIARGEVNEETVAMDPDGTWSRTMKSVSLKDRLRAWELLGKRHQLFTENVNLQLKQVPQIVEDIPDE